MALGAVPVVAVHDPASQPGRGHGVCGRSSALNRCIGLVTAAALATGKAITDTSKLPAPALQRGEPQAEQHGQLSGLVTISHALIEDLQGLPAH